MKVPFDLHRQIPLVRRFLQERDKLLEEKDALASEVNALHMQLDVMGKNSVSMHSKIAELESELQRRPSELDSENLAKLAYEQLRTNYGAIERYLPRTTAAVFSRSQLQQELFVLEQLDFKRCGFFLEVGVGPGVEYSNTYLLERTFGWRGVLCEPNPHYADSIRAHRSVPLDTRAAYSSSDEKLRFLCVPGDYGVLSTIADFQDSDRHKRWGDEIEVATVSLNDLLVQHNVPREIDYLSLDTEGSEVSILEVLDLDRWHISIMTIEHNGVVDRVKALDGILLPAGYRRVLSDVSKDDAWYVKM